MLSNVKCIPVTPMAFNNSVKLTDLLTCKADCRYIYTKQSVAGMHPDISWMIFPKWNMTFTAVIAVSQCLKLQEEFFMDHAFTLIL